MQNRDLYCCIAHRSIGCILTCFRDVEQLCISCCVATPLLHRAFGSTVYAISIYTYKYVYHAYYELLRVHCKLQHLARGSEEPRVYSGLTDCLAQQNGTLTQLGQ